MTDARMFACGLLAVLVGAVLFHMPKAWRPPQVLMQRFSIGVLLLHTLLIAGARDSYYVLVRSSLFWFDHCAIAGVLFFIQFPGPSFAATRFIGKVTIALLIVGNLYAALEWNETKEKAAAAARPAPMSMPSTGRLELQAPVGNWSQAVILPFGSVHVSGRVLAQTETGRQIPLSPTSSTPLNARTLSFMSQELNPVDVVITSATAAKRTQTSPPPKLGPYIPDSSRRAIR